MRSEEFLKTLTEETDGAEALKTLRENVPLGVDVSGETVLSQMREHTFTPRHTCVTGARRTAFLKRTILTLSRLYDKNEAVFLVLSPRVEYGELLRLQGIDLTVPYIRSRADLDSAMTCARELVGLNEHGKGYPRLILVLDGLEEIAGCNANGDLLEYREILEFLIRKPNTEVFSGVELMKSIFSGDPGVFVGVGNCLVTTREEGKADVTYVGDDSSLSMPTALTYPDTPSIIETVIAFNAMQRRA